MNSDSILRLGALKDVAQFKEHVKSCHLTIPCDTEILTGSASPLRTPIQRGPLHIGNRITVQPMEAGTARAMAIPPSLPCGAGATSAAAAEN